MKQKQTLILYYSFTNQTSRLVGRFREGLESCGVVVQVEKLRPAEKIPFPFPSIPVLLKYMVLSFFRWRVPLQPLEITEPGEWDLIVVAGPTWSYNPSGPVLWLLDTYGKRLLAGREVVPIISCRAYWRTHFYSLRSMIVKCGGSVRKPVVFVHPTREPWKTSGLVLQLLGRLPVAKDTWFRSRYPHYGHGATQFELAEEEGRRIGQELMDR